MLKDFEELDTEKINSFLNASLEAIKNDENIDELKQYRKLLKKNIPFMMRSYFSAYLIKLAVEHKNYPYYNKKAGVHLHKKKERISMPKVILPEEDSASLFIGIGRGRGISPKDILSLIIREADIKREEIGEIRILENCSFVKVLDKDADSIVEKLKNSYFRGKRLSISRSRKKFPSDFVSDKPHHELHEVAQTVAENEYHKNPVHQAELSEPLN